MDMTKEARVHFTGEDDPPARRRGTVTSVAEDGSFDICFDDGSFVLYEAEHRELFSPLEDRPQYSKRSALFSAVISGRKFSPQELTSLIDEALDEHTRRLFAKIETTVKQELGEC